MKLNVLTLALVVAGIIHILPVIGVLGSERINTLYDLQVADPNLLLLLKHRAILFSVVGIVMFAAVFNPLYQSLAISLGTLSMLTFIGFVYFGSGISPSLVSIARVDLFALLFLWVGIATDKLL